MSITPTELLNKTSAELIRLRNDYQRKRTDLPRMHRSGGRVHTLSTDIRRCDDAIRMINDILRKRSRRGQPLAEFK